MRRRNRRGRSIGRRGWAARSVVALAVLIVGVELLSFLPVVSDSSLGGPPPTAGSASISTRPTGDPRAGPDSGGTRPFTVDPIVAGQSPLEDDGGSGSCDGACGIGLLTAASTGGGEAAGDILVAALTTYGEANSPLSAANVSDTYGGSPWTLLGAPTSWDGTASDLTYVFYSSPTTGAGSGSVSVSFGNDSTTDASLAWFSFSGVNPSTPVETFSAGNSSGVPGTQPSASVSTVNPNDVIVGFVGDSATVGAQPTTETPGFSGTDFSSSDVNSYVEIESVSVAGTQTSAPTLAMASNYANWVLALQGQGADLAPDSGLPGDASVTVSGYGYLPDSPIEVDFAASPVDACTANATGALFGCTFEVPDIYPGNYVVTVSDGTHTAYSPFAVNFGCGVSLAEAAGPADFVLPLGGVGTFNWYIANLADCPEVIGVQLPVLSGSDPPTLSASPSVFTVNPRQESVVQLTAEVPNDLGDAGQSWTRVAGAEMLGPCYSGACVFAGVAKGVSVSIPLPTFSESGLPSGLTWSVTYNGVTNSLTTDGGTDTLSFAYVYPGNYAYSIAAVPGYTQNSIPPSGTQTVAGADPGVSVSYSVSAAISLTPGQGPVGTTYLVAGTGFTDSAEANVSFGGVVQTPTGGPDCSFAGRSITTDPSGDFVCAFTVPHGTLGSYVVVGADATTETVSAPETFTVVPVAVVAPAQGPVGATYTVTGSGFSGTSGVTVTFGGALQAPTGGSDCSHSGTAITTGAAGKFVCTFAVPSVGVGAYPIEAQDVATGTSSIASEFNVTKMTVSLTPDVGPVGATYTVSGAGFSVASSAIVRFDGSVQTPSACSIGRLSGSTITTGGRGAFRCTFSVPSVAAGPFAVVGENLATDAHAGAKTFDVTALKATLTPGRGPVGATVSLSGSGFSVSSTVRLVFDGVEVSTCSTGSLTTDPAGAFGCAFRVPSATSGTTVLVEDVGGSTKTDKFTVTTPKITVTPKRGAVGSTVSVAGTGFSVGDSVALVFDGVTIPSCTTGSLTASASGAWSCTFDVPAGTAGTTVTATDVGGQTAVASFRVT